MENSKVAYTAIQHVYKLKKELKSKLQNWDIWSDSDQAWILVIKLQSLSALNTILDACNDECTKSKSVVVMNIKNYLTENINIKDFRDVSPSLLETLTPTLEKFEKYLKKHAPDSGRMSMNVELLNAQLLDFKKILQYPHVTFTPDNIRQYLKKRLYIWVDQKDTIAVLAVLSDLLQKEVFDIHLPGNVSRLRAIRFLLQLKHIFEEKKEKFEHKEDAIGNGQKPKKEKSIASVVVHEVPSKRKTFDEYLDAADKDFSTGGIALLQRAQEKYEKILHDFVPLPEQIAYINQQINRIKSTLQYIVSSTNALSSSDTVNIPNPSQERIDTEKINQKTWQIKDDFFRPER